MKNAFLRFKIKYVLFLPLFFFLQCTNNGDDRAKGNIEQLAKGFKNPPAYSRPGAFWCWLNGNMSKEAITRDLKEMSEKGMGRAEIWDVAAVYNTDNYIPAGPAFLSDSSVTLIKHAFDEGRKYGIKIGMVGSSGWNAGGTWVEPEWASKQLYFSEMKVHGPVEKSISLAFPEVPEQCPKDREGNPLFYKEVAVLAIPYNDGLKQYDKEDIIDLSDSLSGNDLDMKLPKGDWIIMRFVCSNNGQMLIVPTPNSKGLFIDFLDPESTRKHLLHFMDRLGVKSVEKREGGLAYLEFDSMELAEGIPWTDAMPSIFKERRGYDIRKYLPVLTGWRVGDDSDKFLYDWKKTVSDQLIHSHYNTGRQFLAEYNIDLVAEAGGPGPPIWNTCPVDALKALGNVSIPRGEFWIRHRNMFLIKEVASASHIYGKDMVDAESFTTWRRWKDSPFALKKVVDRAFCEGLNCVTFHTFASTNPEDGLPGRTYHAGVDINPGTTWWEKSPPFMDYLSRCSYMLQKGKFVADVCYFYGDQAPNFFPLYHDVPEKPVLKGLSKGYDFDVVNSDVILNRMSVENGRIVLPDGMSYSIMVLPDQVHMPLNVLEKLEAMVLDGATIIGKKPRIVPDLYNHSDNTEKLTGIAEKMWENLSGKEIKINAYGKGRVVDGLSATELLNADNIVQDFDHGGAQYLDYIHRKSANEDIYFVRNETDSNFSDRCIFRQRGKFPELWDPSTGEQRRINNFTEEKGTISLPLKLSPGGSAFIVFTDKKRKNLPAIASDGILKEEKVSGPWKVNFPEGWGAPVEVSFAQLISWTDSDVDGIKYFSGTAAYNKTISIDKPDEGKKVSIDLGEFRDVAEVYVNGQSAGILWKKPHVLDITKLVKPGNNELKIEIVNMWINRLTGDMLSEPEDRYCRTNHPYVIKDNWAGGGDETYSIQTSGLLGPVRLVYR